MIRSDGTPWRPVVHVEDICAAFVAVLDAPRAVVHNQAFNVGRTDQNYRINELADIVCQTVPGSAIEYAAGGGPDKRCYRVDCDKLRRQVPAFRPQWDVRRGVQQLYDAYRRVPLTAEDVREQRFLRLPMLNRLMASEMVDADLRRTSTARTAVASRPMLPRERVSMIFTPTEIEGAYVIDIEPIVDERGLCAGLLPEGIPAARASGPLAAVQHCLVATARDAAGIALCRAAARGSQVGALHAGSGLRGRGRSSC